MKVGFIDDNNMMMKGVFFSATELPLKPKLGDSYLILRDESTRTWTGQEWEIWGGIRPERKISLNYRGIDVIVSSNEEIESLMEDPNNLTTGDLGLWEMTYPDSFRLFREGWAKAKGEKDFDDLRKHN